MTDEHNSFDVPLGRLLSVAPGMPTTDMARTVEHYGRLGFTFSAPGSPSLDATRPGTARIPPQW